MMRFVALTSILLGELFSPSTTEPTWNDYIYRIQADGCRGNVSIVSTGFKLKGEAGIIAALHAVAGCDSLSVRPSIGGKKLNFEGPFKVERVNFASDLALISSPTVRKQDGLEVGDPKNIHFKDEFTVPGHAYGKIAPMESLLVALHDTEPKPLRDVLSPAAGKTYRNRQSPDLDALAMHFQGPLGKGQSGAPIIDSSHRVIAVVNGGAGEKESSYVWGMVLDRASGGDIGSGPRWISREQASQILLTRKAYGSGDYYYADETLVEQEVTLRQVDVKASAHFWKHPLWNIDVFIDKKESFAINITKDAHNWLKHPEQAIRGRATVEGTALLGDDSTILISCEPRKQLTFGARATDLTNEKDRRRLVLSNETFIPCPTAGKTEVVTLEMKNSNIFKRGDFVMHFTVTGRPLEDNAD